MKSRIQIILYTKTKLKLNNTIVSGVILNFLFVKIHFKWLFLRRREMANFKWLSQWSKTEQYEV